MLSIVRKKTTITSPFLRIIQESIPVQAETLEEVKCDWTVNLVIAVGYQGRIYADYNLGTHCRWVIYLVPTGIHQGILPFKFHNTYRFSVCNT